MNISEFVRQEEEAKIDNYYVVDNVNVLQEGVKFDQGKVPLHLLAPDAMEAIAEVLGFGAKKYAPRNWEKGMDWSRPYGACLRHLYEWWKRKDKDKETGMSHLWHAGCCIMFLISYELRKVGTDDRP